MTVKNNKCGICGKTLKKHFANTVFIRFLDYDEDNGSSTRCEYETCRECANNIKKDIEQQGARLVWNEKEN